MRHISYAAQEINIASVIDVLFMSLCVGYSYGFSEKCIEQYLADRFSDAILANDSGGKLFVLSVNSSIAFRFSEFAKNYAEIPNFCPRKRKIFLRKSLRINDRAFLDASGSVNSLEKPSFCCKTAVLHPLAQGKNP